MRTVREEAGEFGRVGGAVVSTPVVRSKAVEVDVEIFLLLSSPSLSLRTSGYPVQ